MNVYFDSSAWAKRYIDEKNSAKVEEICNNADMVTLSVLCVPEIISAFSRLFREGKLSRYQFDQIKKQFYEEIRDAKLINLTPNIIKKSVEFLETFPLRTLDALHVACATATQIDLFVTADLRQSNAAEKSGIIIKVV